jgi:hypothetical protein
MFRQPGSTSEGRIELPYSEVRTIYSETAKSIGYASHHAEMLGQSVWHLTNRGIDGAMYAWVYLALVRDLPADALNPRRDSEGRLHVLCPIQASDLLVEAKLVKGEPAQGQQFLFSGVGAPLLMLPILSHALKTMNYDQKAARIRFSDTDVVMEDSALTIESQGRLGPYTVFAPKGTDVVVSFEKSATNSSNGITYHKQRFETLWVNEKRLRPDGLLDLT